MAGCLELLERKGILNKLVSEKGRAGFSPGEGRAGGKDGLRQLLWTGMIGCERQEWWHLIAHLMN